MNLMYPSVIVDGFFENPDAVVNFAKNQQYTPDLLGSYPGERTNCLSVINPNLFQVCLEKIFSIFYNFTNESVNWECNLSFQRIPCGQYDEGWIHSDGSILSFLIYLNKQETLDGGTSICRLKKDATCSIKSTSLLSYKEALYKNEINLEQSIDAKNKQNGMYDEVLLVPNVYNRLFVFEGGMFHKAQKFSSFTEDRLTLVGFINKINSTPSPIMRMRRYG